MKISPPAFPTYLAENMAHGMSLRDYFAAASINVFLEYDLPLPKEHRKGMDWVAKKSYELADRMMEVREE